MDKLNDHPDSIWFHYKAIKLLGFQTCYELSSLALQEDRDGRVKSTVARYYNGCVMKELEERGFRTNEKTL